MRRALLLAAVLLTAIPAGAQWTSGSWLYPNADYQLMVSGGVTATLQDVTDGDGTATALQVSTAAVASGGQLQLTTVAADLQWLASGTPVAEWSVYDDGAAKWLAAGDGGGDATGDGRVAASYYMVGPTASGGIIKGDGSGGFLFRDHTDANYASLAAYTLTGLNGARMPLLDSTANVSLLIQSLRTFSSADNAVDVAGTATNTSGEFGAVVVKPNINSSGTASAAVIVADPTLTAVGSGGLTLFSGRVGGSEKFSVSSTGMVNATVGGIMIPNGAYPAATCTVGEIYIDTDESDDTNCATTADNSLCICTATNTWTALENN
jgi:hypothetical protein